MASTAGAIGALAPTGTGTGVYGAAVEVMSVYGTTLEVMPSADYNYEVVENSTPGEAEYEKHLAKHLEYVANGPSYDYIDVNSNYASYAVAFDGMGGQENLYEYVA